MKEVIFPVFGAAFVLLCVLPFSALVAKIGLVLVERYSGALSGLGVRYVLLITPNVLPLAWFFSAGLHQAESGTSTLACLFEHEAPTECFESGLFSFAVGLVMLAQCAAKLRQGRGPELQCDAQSERLLQRISRLVHASPALQRLRGRIWVTGEREFALGTHGLLWPRVYVSPLFAQRVSDDMLAGAFGHEVAHVNARDPLRYLLLELALALNPLGSRLLAPHVARWHAAREAQCDREAVLGGAAPLALAEAIVRAARPSLSRVVPLGACNTAVLKFRIALLLAFAERRPVGAEPRGTAALSIGLALLIVTLLLPHSTGTAALDVVHSGAEQTLTYFWR